MTAVHSTTVIFFYVQLIACVTSQGCPSGYFGTSCKYKCRCTRDMCEVNGSCLGGDTCLPGWFGPACQYADIAYGQPSGNYLTDGDDDTCRDYTGMTGRVTVNLNESYPFTWLRVHFNSTEAVSNLHLTFNNTVSCSNPRSAPVDGQTWDIYCSMDEFVKSVTLTGPAAASLCSIYISGGRNVAINENAQHTSTWETYSASLSVDGKVNPYFYVGKTCSATLGNDSTPDSWNVTFSRARVVNRYVIYSRADVQTYRLQGFSLQSFDGSTRVFNYTNSQEILPVYTVKHGYLQMSFVQITSGSPDKVLQMCEMEIFGDSICADGQYGRECEHTCNCDGGQPCFVSTGGCPSGCASGYQGENCWLLRQSDTSGCPSGYFGTGCEYKCRCKRDNCEVNGSCLGGDTCLGGWFGPACQYADIANGKPAGHFLTDGNDNTCRDYTGGIGSVTLNLNESYPFTWLRVHVNSTEAVSNLQVTFNNTVSCNNARSAPVDGQTWDIYCSMDEFVKSVTLTGPAAASLCSIYISGGRDIAINQTAQQTSVWSFSGIDYSARLSVDGKVNPDFYVGKTCSATFGGQSTPDSWNVTFSRARVVNRYVIYNRAIEQTYRLTEFSLESFDGSTRVFNYTNSAVELPVYTVKHGHLQMSFVRITSGSPDMILQMCEMEIYGDSICSDGRQYGRECELTCNCDGGQPCFVSTGGCPSRCASGYQGENCKIPCSPGQYGPGCLTDCSTFCVKDTEGVRSCSRFNGACDLGCESGYRGSRCNLVCQPGTYGPQCNNTCSQLCANQTMGETSCDHIHGACRYGCQAGYIEPLCLSSCEAGKYGPSCGYNCSSICVSSNTTDQSSCHHVTGVCMFGCHGGYDVLICEQVCQPGTYGPLCNNTCSQQCANQTMEETSCDHVHGACRYGCQAGYMEPLCLSSCDPGTYGPGCGYNCSNICVASNTTGQSPCHHVTGVCMFGCLGGYDVQICEQVSDYGSNEETNNWQLIGIIVGCLLGVIIVAVIIAAGIIVFRRRRTTKSETRGIESRDNVSLSQNDPSKVHGNLSDDGYDIPGFPKSTTQVTTHMASQGNIEPEQMFGADYVIQPCDDSVADTYEEVDDNLASPYGVVEDDSNEEITPTHNCPEYANTS